MKYLCIVTTLAIALSACGRIEVDHKVEGGATVEHKVSISIEELDKYFKTKCLETLPKDYTQAELDYCISGRVNEFIDMTGANL